MLLAGEYISFKSLIFGNSFNNNQKYTDPKEYLEETQKMCLNFLICGGITFLSAWLMISMWTLSARRLILKIKEEYFKTIMNQEQGWFDQTNPYEFSTKVQSQTKTIEQGVKNFN